MMSRDYIDWNQDVFLLNQIMFMIWQFMEFPNELLSISVVHRSWKARLWPSQLVQEEICELRNARKRRVKELHYQPLATSSSITHPTCLYGAVGMQHTAIIRTLPDPLFISQLFKIFQSIRTLRIELTPVLIAGDTYYSDLILLVKTWLSVVKNPQECALHLIGEGKKDGNGTDYLTMIYEILRLKCLPGTIHYKHLYFLARDVPFTRSLLHVWLQSYDNDWGYECYSLFSITLSSALHTMVFEMNRNLSSSFYHRLTQRMIMNSLACPVIFPNLQILMFNINNDMNNCTAEDWQPLLKQQCEVPEVLLRHHCPALKYLILASPSLALTREAVPDIQGRADEYLNQPCSFEIIRCTDSTEAITIFQQLQTQLNSNDDDAII